MKDLQQLTEAWGSWALTANKSENGWESDFPEWEALMAAAWQAACEPDATNRLPLLEKCIAISSESEDFLQNFDRMWDVVEALSQSSLVACRWQIYEAAGAAVANAERLLRSGVEDRDPYARRRAILNLARLRPPDARELADAFMSDPDAYVRQAAISLVLVANDETFVRSALAGLARDPVDHVREAAVRALQERDS